MTRWILVLTLLGALAAAVPVGAQETGPDTEPLPSTLEEAVETRIIQLDVSVVRKGTERRSLPGLRKEMFELRMDGRRMKPGGYERVAFDEVCGQAPDDLPPELLERYLVVMLDFNYLNGQMRADTADALRALADDLPDGYWAKVVGYTRSLYDIVEFTQDPEELRQAAEFVETANWVGGPGIVEDRGPDFSPEGSSLSPLGTSFGPTVAADPWTAGAQAAFGRISSSFGGSELAGLAEALGGIDVSPGRGIVERQGWDPRASLAALEAVLRGHRSLRGRKALILFTGEGFYLNDADLERETEGVFAAAQAGFTLWVVDAVGFSSGGALPAYRSNLMTKLAGDTGGETLRSAGDIGMVFPRAREALDCYYLFSIPVEHDGGERQHSFVVSLKTDEYPDLWGHVVRHRTHVRLYDRRTDRQNSRTAALLSPGLWQDAIAVRADLSFPAGGGSAALPMEISVPLADLDFRPREGAYEASFLVDAAVDRDGKDTVCLVPRRGEATIHRVRLDRPPPEDAPGHLVIRETCPYRGKGVYSVRAAITDPEIGQPGATRATYRIQPRPGPEMDVGALRVGHNTGQEFLLENPGEGTALVPQDTSRAAFVPLLEGDAAAASDILMFRYVLCGPSRQEAKDGLHRLIYRKEGDDARIQFLLPGSNPGQPLAESYEKDDFCVEIEDRLPPDELKPGTYGFALIRSLRGERLSRSAIEEALATGAGELFLGKLEFAVR